LDPAIFRILERKQRGEALSEGEIHTLSTGAADGSWGDAELGAFLASAMIHGLDDDETRALTQAMLESGERWDLADEIPHVGDKHSTGGVGDKVSLILAPLLAACGRPVVMLTGRGLGHTGGTADKLEAIPGIELDFDRTRCLDALEATGLAIGIATEGIAPADRRLYALRDRTATIASLPLITASILSKKLATGAAAFVFDVKTGDGAFLPERERAAGLAQLLVDVSSGLGRPARALLTDMSQPLGRWVGHAAEVRESLDALEGRGPEDLMEVTFALSEELSELTGERLERAELEAALASGRAREHFERWAVFQGAPADFFDAPELPLAPIEVAIEARRPGVLARVENRHLGELLAAAGGGRLEPGGEIDMGVSLRVGKKIGDAVEKGEEIARVYLRREDPVLVREFRASFEIGDAASAPELVLERFTGGS